MVKGAIQQVFYYLIFLCLQYFYVYNYEDVNEGLGFGNYEHLILEKFIILAFLT